MYYLLFIAAFIFEIAERKKPISLIHASLLTLLFGIRFGVIGVLSILLYLGLKTAIYEMKKKNEPEKESISQGEQSIEHDITSTSEISMNHDELYEMRAKGLISEKEFELLKDKIGYK